MRHGYFGDDGYINYPDIFKIARIFAEIYKLEYERESVHSSDCDDPARYKLCIEFLNAADNSKSKIY
jgi:hypothetical protein